MNKYSLYAGCSFTWGQGLWSYLETKEHVPSYEEWIFENKKLPKGSIEIKNKLNFPNIVSKQNKTIPVFKTKNGGTDFESVQCIYKWINKYNSKNIDILIFQTTQQYRSPFYFEHKGEKYHLRPTPNFEGMFYLNKLIFCDDSKLNIEFNDTNYNINIFYDWLFENKLDIEKFREIHLNQIMNHIEDVFKYCESLGIKPYILSWTDEYLDYIHKSKYLKNKFINFEYKKNQYDCIQIMQEKNKELFLRNDTSTLHNPGNDEHPSKECHEIIAKSILKKYYNE